MLEGKKVSIQVSDGAMNFDPIPADKYLCQIVDVNAVEAPNPFKGGAVETKLNFQFVLLDEKKELKPGVSLRGRYLWKRTSLSMNEKSWLYKLAKAVYGHELSIEEQKKFDPEAIVGMRVDCMVEQQPSKDGSKIYSNIISFTKASPKGVFGQEVEDFDYAAAKAKSVERSSKALAPADEFEQMVEESIKKSNK